MIVKMGDVIIKFQNHAIWSDGSFFHSSKQRIVLGKSLLNLNSAKGKEGSAWRLETVHYRYYLVDRYLDDNQELQYLLKS